MTSTQQMTHGDFTGLAEDYSTYREGYAESVRDALFGLRRRPASDADVVDVGAGTGIWTRMLAQAGPRSVTAVEPNPDMRRVGERDSAAHPITWREGHGEDTGLPGSCADLVTMASSFHWVDFDRATAEFHRLLRPRGWFAALWNPRFLEANPVLADIEAELTRLEPGLRRVSSARSETIQDLRDRFRAHPLFDDVTLLEGEHVAEQSVDRYIGIWRSVNDVRVQLGEAKFDRFLAYTRDRLADHDTVEVTYLTRAVAARRRD